MAKKQAVAAHPPYAEMIKEAIVALKERNGSSLAAIKKYIGGKYKLPEGWEKKLSLYLKKMTETSRLVKVKASWKLGATLKSQAPKTKKPAAVKKPAMTKKPKKPKAKKPKAAAPKKKTASTKTKSKVPAKPKSKVMKKTGPKKAASKKSAPKKAAAKKQ